MATSFTPRPGRGGCADPLQCSVALVETAMPSKESSGATEPVRRRCATYSCALAWRLRRAEIQGLARRGRVKSDMAKRIPVPMDTTLCKRWFPEDVTLAHSLLQRASIYQMFCQRGRPAVCMERLVDLVLHRFKHKPESSQDQHQMAMVMQWPGHGHMVMAMDAMARTWPG